MINRKLLKISSDDRHDTKQPTHDFSVSFSNTSLQNVKSVALKHLTFRHTINNINSTNTQLEIYLGMGLGVDIGDGSGFTANKEFIVIPQGQFTGSELAQVITDALDLQLSPDVFVCSLDANDYFEITCSTANISILGTPTNEIGRILGFSEDISIANPTITAQSRAQLSIPELYLHSSLSQNHCIDAKGYISDQFTVVSLAQSPYGSIVSYSSQDINSDLVIFINKRDITNVKISIRDNKGKLLDLDNQEINLLFELFY
jgi:hypothetical protein